MIKIENVVLPSTKQWQAVIRGMRNPMNSWDKSDSGWYSIGAPGTNPAVANDQYLTAKYCIGDNDVNLMKRLVKAGTDHRKFMRMIPVYVDITAPLYWVAEHDTYKIATVRNSCSFMHKGVSKPFSINDFSVDEQISYLLNPIKKEQYELTYPYETDEYKIYELDNGRKYKIFRNGRIVACEFSYTDNYGSGRTRTFAEREIKPSRTASGYFEVNIGGRSGEKWVVHRLVATVWHPNPNHFDTVNHINANKGDNSVENLEWCSRSDNIKLGFKDGLYEKNKLHLAYNSWKLGHTNVSPMNKFKIRDNYSSKKLTIDDLKEEFDLSSKQIYTIVFHKPCNNEELFRMAYLWEHIINVLNELRSAYLETHDENIFFAIRQLLPQGYNVRYTWMANYEVLANIYKSRKNHRLPEWVEFCKWIETLPYSELITGEFDV